MAKRAINNCDIAHCTEHPLGFAVAMDSYPVGDFLFLFLLLFSFFFSVFFFAPLSRHTLGTRDFFPRMWWGHWAVPWCLPQADISSAKDPGLLPYRSRIGMCRPIG